jgi:GNAT superfamily N-acetyltransferase
MLFVRDTGTAIGHYLMAANLDGSGPGLYDGQFGTSNILGRPVFALPKGWGEASLLRFDGSGRPYEPTSIRSAETVQGEGAGSGRNSNLDKDLDATRAILRQIREGAATGAQRATGQDLGASAPGTLSVTAQIYEVMGTLQKPKGALAETSERSGTLRPSAFSGRGDSMGRLLHTGQVGFASMSGESSLFVTHPQFRQPLGPMALAGLAGIENGGMLTARYFEPKNSAPYLSLIGQHPFYDGYRSVNLNLGPKPYVDISQMFLKPDFQGAGLASRAVATIARTAQEAGIDRLKLLAVGAGPLSGIPNPDGYNGYYTWPVLGFDGYASVSSLEKINSATGRSLRAGSKVIDVIGTPGGRTLWKTYGSPFHAEFDLSSPNTRSMRTLTHYLSGKGIYPYPW